MNSTEEKLAKLARLRTVLQWSAIVIGVLAVLATMLLMVFPVAVQGRAVPTPTPAPTPVPTAAPAAAAPAAAVPSTLSNRSNSIYYRYDPALFAADERGRISYYGEGYRCLTGIDVSEHQYDIDWDKVASDGIDFAIIRSGYRGYTSGGIHEDKFFRQNMDGAAAAGVPVGVYFFSQATTVREAREEAEFVLDQIKDYDVTMPVIFDMEILSQEYRTYSMSRRTLYKCTRAFCDTVREAGYDPMIYMTQYLGYQKYTLRELTDYDFWFAEYYVGYPSFVYDFSIWQYSDTGSVAGVEGNVDLDLYMIRE